jgi:hypothetical protein
VSVVLLAIVSAAPEASPRCAAATPLGSTVTAATRCSTTAAAGADPVLCSSLGGIYRVVHARRIRTGQ